MSNVILILFAYLVGSVCWGFVVCKMLFNVDIRKGGSNNPGATNAVRVCGPKAGLIVLFLDASKIVSVGLASFYLIENVSFWEGGIIYLPLLACFLGHVFPVFLKFKGGKGVACLVGIFVFFNWLIALIGFFLFMAIVVPTKKVSLGSLITPVILIICQIAFAFIEPMDSKTFNYFLQTDAWWVNTILLVSMYLIVVWTHRGNIQRLIKGKENTFLPRQNK